MLAKDGSSVLSSHCGRRTVPITAATFMCTDIPYNYIQIFKKILNAVLHCIYVHVHVRIRMFGFHHDRSGSLIKLSEFRHIRLCRNLFICNDHIRVVSLRS